MTPDPLPFANFIVARLLKTLPGFPASPRAVAETERPIEGDDWYWADDNAKVLELLSLPEIWRAHPDAVTDIVRFVIGMCDGPLIYRRLAAPRFTVQQNEGAQGAFLHSLMNISCDLAHGLVTLGMRFHDGRTARNATFGGNYVRFRHAGRVYTVDAEAGIHRTEITPHDGGVRLLWTAAIEFVPSRFSRARLRAGELTTTCTIAATSMFVDVETTLDINPELEIADVILTFGCDNLSHNDNNIRYELLTVAPPGGPPIHHSASANDRFTLPLQGARTWTIAQTSQMAGFAAAIHALPREPARVTALQGVCDEHARLHWVVAEHSFPGPQHGTIAAAERKIITAGGFYADTELYARALTRQSQYNLAGAPPIDLSVSYDYGAEINALARCLRTLQLPDPPITGPHADALRAEIAQAVTTLSDAYDAYFIKPAHTDASPVFSRSLAYVAFAHAEMLRAGGGERHAAALREICGLVAGFERINKGVDGAPQSGFAMGTDVNALPYVDCHATCLLALVRGTTALDTPEWLDAIDRGLAAFCLDTQEIFFVSHQKIDIVAVDYTDPNGKHHRLETFWNFKSGLCLQLLGALRATAHAGLRAVWDKHRERIEMLELIMRARIEKSLRTHADGIEILTSMLSAETNSETQPWVALGLIGET